LSIDTRKFQMPQSELNRLSDSVKKYLISSHADNTRRAYATDWRHFTAWCSRHDFTALPCAPETLMLYLTESVEAGYKISTIQRRLSAISVAHQAAEIASPIDDMHVRMLWRGIRRKHGIAVKGALPITIPELRAMMEHIPDTIQGFRDRTLILIGFAGAFRRSELVSLDVEDLTFQREGIVILLRHSKTDQEGEGRKIAIPYGSRLETCPVRAMQDWLAVSRIEQGAIFRRVNKGDRVEKSRLTGDAVAKIIKRAIQNAGLDPTHFSGHSLRAGFATAAAQAGVDERNIQRQTGHKSVAVLRGYIRDGNLFRQNAAADVGL
jgi:integrase